MMIVIKLHVVTFIFERTKSTSLISDDNECEDGTHNCDPHTEVCVNTIGGYECHCKPGYHENPVTHQCEGKIMVFLYFNIHIVSKMLFLSFF